MNTINAWAGLVAAHNPLSGTTGLPPASNAQPTALQQSINESSAPAAVASGLPIAPTMPTVGPVVPASQSGAPVASDAARASEAKESLMEGQFDEMINQTALSVQDYLRIARKRPYETPEMTIQEKYYWNYPRRWKLALYGITLVNLLKDDLDAFLDFELGTDRDEYRVEIDGKQRILAVGSSPIRERTSVVHHVSNDPKKPSLVPFNIQAEWRGSYSDLNTHKLRISAWQYRRLHLNSLEGIREEPLANFVNSSLHVNRHLYKMTEGKRLMRCEIRFEFFIQEIYDFELSFLGWSAHHFVPAEALQHVAEGDDIKPQKRHRVPHYVLKFVGLGHLHGLTLSSSRVESMSPVWDNAGAMLFRGTLMELENSAFNIELIDETSKSLTIATGFVRLLGVINHTHLEGQLMPPNWFLKPAFRHLRHIADSKALKKLEHRGRVEGKISIMKRPLHNQSGQFLALTAGSQYLIVRIKNIDKIVTRDSRVMADVFVSVAFRGEVRTTRIVTDTISPEFEEDIPLPIYIEDLNQLTRPDYPGAEQIWFDVWIQGMHSNDHAGGCYCEFWDIFHDKRGLLKLPVERQLFDRQSMKVVTYMTRVHEGQQQLQLSFDADRASSLTYEVYTIPDVVTQLGISGFRKVEYSSVPNVLDDQLHDVKRDFEEVCAELNRTYKIGRREFTLERENHRGVKLLLPLFLARIVPPRLVDTPQAVFQYVRSLPFRELFQTYTRFASPDFTMTGRVGSPTAHALLHASFLLGMSLQAYCCLGTLIDGTPYVWVMEIIWRDENLVGNVRFWESSTGVVYELRRRIHDRQHFMFMDSRRVPHLSKRHSHEVAERSWWLCCRRRHRTDTFLVNEDFGVSLPVETEGSDGSPACPLEMPLPYRTLDIIFNNQNVWVNKQNPDPARIWYDVWDQKLWHKCIQQDVVLTPAFTTPAFLPPHSDFVLRQMEAEAYEQITREISLHRSVRNLNTLWNKDPALQSFLRKGLHIRYRREVCAESDQPFVEVQLMEWKRALMTKVPPSWRLNGTFMRFAAADAVLLGNQILENCDFVETRSRLTMFALGVRCSSYPGQISSTFIVLIATTKVSEGEKRRLNFERMKRERMKLHRNKVEEETIGPMLDRMESMRRSMSIQGAESMAVGGSARNVSASVTPMAAGTSLSALGSFEAGREDEDIDWEAIYADIRSEAPEEYDKLYEYYVTEGFDDESAKYWAAYYVKKLLGEDEDIPQFETDL